MWRLFLPRNIEVSAQVHLSAIYEVQELEAVRGA
jgi:hypothetical protein